jgi:hypothetical protein
MELYFELKFIISEIFGPGPGPDKIEILDPTGSSRSAHQFCTLSKGNLKLQGNKHVVVERIITSLKE